MLNDLAGAWCDAGTYAEYIAVAEADVALMPTNLSFEAAASVPPGSLTAYQVTLSMLWLTASLEHFGQVVAEYIVV